MKKTFPLESPDHAPARVVESIKNDVRRYLKRERRKSLPEGVDFWDFDCRVGTEVSTAEVVEVRSLVERIDLAAQAGWGAIYIEILAKRGHRAPRPESPASEGG